MDSKVIVTGDATGSVIVKSKNPVYGYIRVEQNRTMIDDDGFAKDKVISALVPGTIQALKNLGWSANQELPGKIIIKESLIPFNTKDLTQNLKVAGSSGVICCKDDAPIYMKRIYNANSNAVDILIPHTNGDEIRAAYAAAKEDVSNNTDFSL